ncbi:MAG TPA: hypothetical protein PKV48_03040, partial [Thermodesulfobacteriota bacterium]|nr:hypothetical protein [Thermodesulfobacteriota bacterium]
MNPVINFIQLFLLILFDQPVEETFEEAEKQIEKRHLIDFLCKNKPIYYICGSIIRLKAILYWERITIGACRLQKENVYFLP